MSDLYEYPQYYEIIFGSRDFKKECDFIKQIFDKFSKIKINSVLDIACGNGLHMKELIKSGFNVGGLDISEKMIKEVEDSSSQDKHFIGCFKRDMTSFKLPIKFDACICMVNSLEILTKNEQIISHLDSIANCLNKGGIYFIELDSPAFLFSNPIPGEKIKGYKRKFKKGNIKINLVYKKLPFDLVNFLEKNELIIEVNDNKKKIKIIDDSPVRRLVPSDIDLFLRLSNKFELIRILGDFNLDSSLNDKDSRKMIIILRKI